MSNSELMLAAVTNGLTDDATASAALDAIREESGCTLLAAVLELARVYNSAADARDMQEATALLNKDGSIRHELNQSILSECPEIRPTDTALILVVDGDRWPIASKRAAADYVTGITGHIVSVGARWVKREASRLMLERERRANRARRRRSK